MRRAIRGCDAMAKCRRLSVLLRPRGPGLGGQQSTHSGGTSGVTYSKMHTGSSHAKEMEVSGERSPGLLVMKVTGVRESAHASNGTGPDWGFKENHAPPPLSPE